MSLARIKQLIAEAAYYTAEAKVDPDSAEARRHRARAQQLLAKANELAELGKPGANTRFGYTAVVGVEDGRLRVFFQNGPALLNPEQVTDPEATR